MSDLRGYIRQRGKKLEAVIVQPGGEKVRRSTGLNVGQEAEAEAILAEALRQLESETAPAADPDTWTVKAWGLRWLENRQKLGKGDWIYERGHLQNFVFGPLGHLPLTEVTGEIMLDWARGLAQMRGPTGGFPGPKYVRRITATVRAMFKAAVKEQKRTKIDRTPCIWDNTDLPEMEANSRITGECFEAADVARLIYDPRIPEERRVLYALEFLTGMRTGEAAVRRWKDWEPVYRERLGRLIAATAYSTRHHIEKATKTRVEKWIPVHPALAAILVAWQRDGFERFVGRPPTQDDLIVPAVRGGCRNNSYSWRMFQEDLDRVGLPRQRHYDTRSAFISLAEGAGAKRQDVALITHASINGAKDLYRRVKQLWPVMCDAVECIKLPAPEGAADRSTGSPPSQPTEEPGQTGAEHPEPAASRDEYMPSIPLPCRFSPGSQTGASMATTLAKVPPPGTPPPSTVTPSVTPPASGALPDAAAAFAEACARAAAAALDAGDLPRARELLERALRAIDGPAPVRLVGRPC